MVGSERIYGDRTNLFRAILARIVRNAVKRIQGNNISGSAPACSAV